MKPKYTKKNKESGSL